MDGTPSFAGLNILLVEDDFLLAHDLTGTLRDLGITVLGPFPSVRQALKLVHSSAHIDAAVLDVNLHGTLVYPVAQALQERGIPFLFGSGYDDTVVPEEYGRVPRVVKPYHVSDVLSMLQAVLLHRAD